MTKSPGDIETTFMGTAADKKAKKYPLYHNYGGQNFSGRYFFDCACGEQISIRADKDLDKPNIKMTFSHKSEQQVDNRENTITLKIAAAHLRILLRRTACWETLEWFDGLGMPE